MKFKFEDDSFGCYDPSFVVLEHGIARFDVHFHSVRRGILIGEGSGPWSRHWSYREFELEASPIEGRHRLESVRIILRPETKAEDILINRECMALPAWLKRELEVFFIPQELLYSDIYKREAQRAQPA